MEKITIKNTENFIKYSKIIIEAEKNFFERLKKIEENINPEIEKYKNSLENDREAAYFNFKNSEIIEKLLEFDTEDLRSLSGIFLTKLKYSLSEGLLYSYCYDYIIKEIKNIEDFPSELTDALSFFDKKDYFLKENTIFLEEIGSRKTINRISLIAEKCDLILSNVKTELLEDEKDFDFIKKKLIEIALVKNVFLK